MSKDLYLGLMKKCINNYLYLGGERGFDSYSPVDDGRYQNYKWTIPRYSQPHSLLFGSQLDLLEKIIIEIDRECIPGDFIETGVWRGGAVIFMRAVLEAYQIPERIVYAADSFAGIPPNKIERNDPVDLWTDRWEAGIEEVKENVRRYGLLDERFIFIRGLFEDSLPSSNIKSLALIRLDADSYESTMTTLSILYPKLSEGGFVIIDDWHLPGCRAAVDEFRKVNKINSKMVHDPANEYWIKGL